MFAKPTGDQNGGWRSSAIQGMVTRRASRTRMAQQPACLRLTDSLTATTGVVIATYQPAGPAGTGGG
jgi:hypothetical protein